MELICYTYYGWTPRIRPASAKRPWMDETPESFAYRCLPLSIANSHGWEILSPCGFEAIWRGGQDASQVEIRVDEGTPAHQKAISLFGQGTITFHVEGLFRTSPGWNLWVGAPPNNPKDGIVALGGVIETDWSPYTFTMNWRFTRPDHWVRFEENEPIATIFPVQRSLIEEIEPKFLPMDCDPELKAQYEKWSISRQLFQEQVRRDPPTRPSDKWQKLYYRGVDPDGKEVVSDHRSKLRLKPFVSPDGSVPEMPEPRFCPVSRSGSVSPRGHAARQAAPRLEADLRKREWILNVVERQRSLSPWTAGLHTREGLGTQEFLDQYYAASRPVVLTGEIADWPALRLWTPEYLKRKLGSVEIEYQGGREASADYERDKDPHRKRMPFDRYMDLIAADTANDAYITAYNSGANERALAPLVEDMGFLDKYLVREGEHPNGMMWIGPLGTFTPLHHDLTNNLLVQIVGTKRIILAPPSEAPRLYNSHSLFSDVVDLMDPDLARFPLAADVRFFEVDLEPGQCLFIPVGWWHQVTALDFSVMATFTNFRWPNDAHESYPG